MFYFRIRSISVMREKIKNKRPLPHYLKLVRICFGKNISSLSFRNRKHRPFPLFRINTHENLIPNNQSPRWKNTRFPKISLVFLQFMPDSSPVSGKVRFKPSYRKKGRPVPCASCRQSEIQAEINHMLDPENQSPAADKVRFKPFRMEIIQDSAGVFFLSSCCLEKAMKIKTLIPIKYG